MIANKEVILVEWCKSEFQLADCFTKGAANCMKLINVLQINTGLLE